MAEGVYLSAAPLPFEVFVWGGKAILKVLNLVRYIALNSYTIWSPTQLNIPPPPPRHILSVCMFCTLTQGRVEMNYR